MGAAQNQAFQERSQMKIPLCVSGSDGRMGRTVLRLAFLDKRFDVKAGLLQPGHPDDGKNLAKWIADLPEAQNIPVWVDPKRALENAGVLIDFTQPEGTLRYLAACARRGCAMVIGTTGFSSAQRAKIKAAAEKIPIVFSSNMSLGMNVLFQLVAEAAKRLKNYDIEIVEAHHHHKKDAPSGSALTLGEAAARARGWALSRAARHGRSGHTGARPVEEIGFHALRAGDIVGDHTVYLAGPAERLELTHRAHNREAFARGALEAAIFVNRKKRGLYSMQDVLGL